ncbi:hypothetical protein KKE92_05685 [Candidatus Micrarchaeota archaeon]|nr:hypothetical protein [Candidatus Micrarchaeota archaeon]MBU1681237.1 hypothetical protein [Candidatus Micrarchaeota archaeon]
MEPKKHTEFFIRCGKIIQYSIIAETEIENFILDYFSQSNYKKRQLFRETFFERLTFGPKLPIFSSICKTEKVNKKLGDNVYKKLKKIVEFRNEIAHCEPRSVDGEIQILSKKVFSKPGHTIEISEKEIQLMKRYVREIIIDLRKIRISNGIRYDMDALAQDH